MRIGRLLWADGSPAEFVASVVEAEQAGFHSAWTPQVFGWDALTLLALAAAQTERIELGTAVVPLYSRHPLVLAAAALTTSTVSGGRLALGIGPSHRFIVEDVWGLDYSRPLAFTRSYLDALEPAMAGQPTDVHDGLVTARLPRPLTTPHAVAPSVLLAAMAPRMLQLAGARADGTITLFAGTGALRDLIVPTITRAAAEASRPAPRVVAGLPVCVTGNPRKARQVAAQQFTPYIGVPAYQRVLARDGATEPAEVALVGSAVEIGEQLAELADVGVTDLMAQPFGDPDELAATCELLLAHAGQAA
ncbi:TIGR03564 family F420-dependent LLM class oxidoreductase [Streptomyces sp. NPDC002516]